MRSDRTLLLLVLCAITPACLDPIPAETLRREEEGSVTGGVKDQCDGKALDGVTVVLGSSATTTDGSGRYRFDGLDAGSQRLVITRGGYLEVAAEVQIAAGTTTTFDVTLSPVPAVREPIPLDLLFVIDNSGSMSEEQQALVRGFPDLLDTLAAAISDIRVGVVSTDLGAGNYGTLPSCEVVGGDRGQLQATPRVAGCAAPEDPFIAIRDGRAVNVAGGDAEAAFACVATLGTAGCGFEHPLEAMRLALEPGGINAGFLRPEAMLGVILLTDEDDCSAADPTIFDPSQTEIVDPLGPLTSFRCFEFGVVCDVNDRNRLGPRQDCRPGGELLHDVRGYGDFLSGLKPSADRVFIGAIVGPTDRVEVGKDGNKPVLREACSSPRGLAAPAIRLKAVVDALNPAIAPKPLFSICEDPLPLKALALQLVSAASLRSCP